MAALQLKKHIYCAKPATHTIAEARRVRAAVLAAKGIVTKTSVQASGTDAARSTSEILMAGILGPIREVHIWCSHPIYPCSLARPTDIQTPPRDMNWDLWIGPAPFRPFNSAYHPEIWRPWWDFGDGTVGDMACHTFHMFFKELQLGAPARIYGCGSTRCETYMKHLETPECQGGANIVTWEFPARGALPPLKVHWYDGGMKPLPPEGVPPEALMRSDGIFFVGEKGVMQTGYYGSSKPMLLAPKEKFQDFQAPPKTLRPVPGVQPLHRMDRPPARPARKPFARSSSAASWRKWRCWARWPCAPRRRSNGTPPPCASPTTPRRTFTWTRRTAPAGSCKAYRPDSNIVSGWGSTSGFGGRRKNSSRPWAALPRRPLFALRQSAAKILSRRKSFPLRSPPLQSAHG